MLAFDDSQHRWTQYVAVVNGHERCYQRLVSQKYQLKNDEMLQSKNSLISQVTTDGSNMIPRNLSGGITSVASWATIIFWGLPKVITNVSLSAGCQVAFSLRE